MDVAFQIVGGAGFLLSCWCLAVLIGIKADQARHERWTRNTIEQIVTTLEVRHENDKGMIEANSHLLHMVHELDARASRLEVKAGEVDQQPFVPDVPVWKTGGARRAEVRRIERE